MGELNQSCTVCPVRNALKHGFKNEESISSIILYRYMANVYKSI